MKEHGRQSVREHPPGHMIGWARWDVRDPSRSRSTADCAQVTDSTAKQGSTPSYQLTEEGGFHLPLMSRDDIVCFKPPLREDDADTDKRPVRTLVRDHQKDGNQFTPLDIDIEKLRAVYREFRSDFTQVPPGEEIMPEALQYWDFTRSATGTIQGQVDVAYAFKTLLDNVYAGDLRYEFRCQFDKDQPVQWHDKMAIRW